MSWVLIFAAGAAIGRKWDVVKSVVAPMVVRAAETVEDVYTQASQSYDEKFGPPEEELGPVDDEPAGSEPEAAAR